jgi:MFS family permease
VPAKSPIAPLIGARSLNTFGRALISSTVYFELFTRTNDNLIVAMVGLIQVIPVILLFTWSGGLADRFDRRWLTTIAAGVTGLVGLGLAVASATDAPPAVFLAILFVQGCVTSVHAPASSSLIPLIFERGELTRVNRIGSSLQELAVITGASLPGVLIYFFPPHYVYAIVAITGIAAAILYRSLPEPRRVADTAAGAARKDWRVGLRYIFKSPLLLPALTLDMFAVLFAGVNALLPAMAEKVLHCGPLGYGLLRAAQSVGALLSAWVTSRIPPWKRPGRVLLIVVALFGAATIAFGLSTSLALSVALLVLCGFLDNISVVIRLTLEQMVVPDAIRGRVSSVHYVFIGMSNELGGFESGAAATLVGTVPAIVGGGAIAMVVVGFVAAKWRELANMPPLAELKPPE